MHQQSARLTPSVATYLRSAQIATILQGSPTPISRWAQHSLLPHQRTLDGHRHYPTVIEQLAAFLVQEVRAA